MDVIDIQSVLEIRLWATANPAAVLLFCGDSFAGFERNLVSLLDTLRLVLTLLFEDIHDNHYTRLVDKMQGENEPKNS